MNLKKIIEDSLDSMWNNSTYGGNNELPRKDYVPYTTSQGYGFPYQQGVDPSIPPQDDGKATTTPWPLQDIETDLSNSFISLLTAIEKLKQCSENNLSLTKTQKKVIQKFIKISVNALKRIEIVGLNFARLLKK